MSNKRDLFVRPNVYASDIGVPSDSSYSTINDRSEQNTAQYAEQVSNKPGIQHVYQPLQNRAGEKHSQKPRCPSAKSISRLSMNFSGDSEVPDSRHDLGSSLTSVLKQARKIDYEPGGVYAEIPVDSKNGSRRKCCIITICTVIIIAVILAVSVATPVVLLTGDDSEESSGNPSSDRFGSEKSTTTQAGDPSSHKSTSTVATSTKKISEGIGGDTTTSRENTNPGLSTKQPTDRSTSTIATSSKKVSEGVDGDTTTSRENLNPGSSTKKPTTIAPINTTVKYGVETRDDYSIESAGSWGSWSEYSTCTVSCGGGQKTRTRVCETENSVTCIGLNRQVAKCNVSSCPSAVIYGTWKSWLGWEDCSTTCGGGITTRTRVCVKPSESAEDCVGNQTQVKGCNTFQCPDCSMNCGSGSISQDCSYCVCDGTYSGQIFSQEGITVANVSISPATSPSEILYVTSLDGRYALSDVCSSEEYLFHCEGYNNKRLLGSLLDGSQVLEKTDSLKIEKHPKSKYLITGDPILLCCHATGSPEPEYYEWYKDNNVLLTLSESGESQLQIANASSEDSGIYFCRANNGYTAIKSNVATVTVTANKTELCQPTPQSKVITLPEGCSWGGVSQIDKGGCPGSPCRGDGSLTEICGTSKENCCSPVSYSRVDVPCSNNISIPILMVTGCGCSKCVEISRMLYGKIKGTDKTDRKYISVYFNGTKIATSQRDGTFTFQLPNDLSKLLLILKDEIFNEYMDTIYIVTISDESYENIYPTIRMVKKGVETQISTTEENDIPVTSPETGRTIAGVIIPANSVYTTEGELYTGTVSVTIGVVDQNDTASLEAAPGDFSTVNEEGDVDTLQSAGMLAIALKDENGIPLSIPGEITISVTSDQIGNVTVENGVADVKFWKLNSVTGSWEFAGYIILSDEKTRKKRQVTGDTGGQDVFVTKIRGITVETEWYNFDNVNEVVCFSKIRVFGGSDFSENHQISDALVGVIVEDTSRNLKSISRIRAWSDIYGENSGGYCISHPCINEASVSGGNKFTASYFVDYNGKEMKPATVNIGIANSFKDRIKYEVMDNVIKVKEVSVLSTDDDGPYYDFDRDWLGFGWVWDSPKCASAPLTENHFRFYDDTSCFQSYTTLETIVPTSANDNCPTDNYLLWHSPTTQIYFFDPESKYRVCFVKVALESVSSLPMKIRVTSKEKIARKDASQKNIFGTRDGCNEHMQKTICLELKDPSRIGCNEEHDQDITDSSITIIVEGINTVRYNVSEISNGLEQHHINNIDRKDHSISIDVSAGSNYGSDYGIYCSESVSGEEGASYKSALDECETSGGSDGGWAVKFTDGCNFKLDVIFVVDNSGSMRGFWNQVEGALFYVTEQTVIGEDFVRVSLVTYNANNPLKWNLGDSDSYDRDHLKSYFTNVPFANNLMTPAEALDLVNEQILETTVDRTDASNIVILISDGDEPNTGLLHKGNEIQQKAKLLIIGTDQDAVDQLQTDLNVQGSENVYYLSDSVASKVSQRLEDIACET